MLLTKTPRQAGVSILGVKGQIINISGFVGRSPHQAVCRYSPREKTHFYKDLFDKILNIVIVIEYAL